VKEEGEEGETIVMKILNTTTWTKRRGDNFLPANHT